MYPHYVVLFALLYALSPLTSSLALRTTKHHFLRYSHTEEEVVSLHPTSPNTQSQQYDATDDVPGNRRGWSGRGCALRCFAVEYVRNVLSCPESQQQQQTIVVT